MESLIHCPGDHSLKHNFGTENDLDTQNQDAESRVFELRNYCIDLIISFSRQILTSLNTSVYFSTENHYQWFIKN